MISIVSPVYQSEKCVPDLVSRIVSSVQNIGEDYEIILVDDGSRDESWYAVQKECSQNPKVKGFKLSRNFGQHIAITAGLEQAKGDWVVVMDCDLQDQPEEIPKLFAAAKEGNDIVLARRVDRQDGFIKKLFSKLFYMFLGYLTETKQSSEVANFGIYSQKVVSTIVSTKESFRYFPALVQWVGFKRKFVDVEHAPRAHGESNYNFSKLLDLGINVALAFSNKPLNLVIRLGLLISAISLAVGIVVIVGWFQGSIAVQGWASLMVSVWFLAGIIIFITGIVGLYVGRIFDVAKSRPLYIVSKAINE